MLRAGEKQISENTESRNPAVPEASLVLYELMCSPFGLNTLEMSFFHLQPQKCWVVHSLLQSLWGVIEIYIKYLAQCTHSTWQELNKSSAHFQVLASTKQHWKGLVPLCRPSLRKYQDIYVILYSFEMLLISLSEFRYYFSHCPNSLSCRLFYLIFLLSDICHGKSRIS